MLGRSGAASFNQWVDEIGSHLPWPDVETRRSFATMVVLTLEGAFILARAERRGDAFTTAGDWLARLAQSMVPVPQRRRRSGARRKKA